MLSAANIILAARADSDNLDFGTNNGIPDADCLRYLNDAKDRLVGLISAVNDDLFVTESVISVVARQEAYAVSGMAFTSRIVSVEYTQSGSSEDYYTLPQASVKNRNTSYGDPSFYWRRVGSIYLNPIPTVSSAKIRVSYEAAVADVASGGTITALPDDCERYLIAYVTWQLLKRDSNANAQEAFYFVKMLEDELLDSFKRPDKDLKYIPVLDPEMT